ncbi:hypothetical protein A4A49_39681 [Nicotiana attenuata]|uniref:AT-hook motif nuclear-localized protein n=1 Tax=Nicotiana attenuata TaxID=49451 RepID=A0A1J6K5N2_NICAT|nr:hypothetical protein A4A49_39681 [Nicotiana attenuata]
MAKGRGRGRGRPRKYQLTTVVNSMVTGNQPLMEKAAPEATPSPEATPPSSTQTADPVKESVACESGFALSHSNISKRLDLTSPVSIGHAATTSIVPVNGIVKVSNPAQNQVKVLRLVGESNRGKAEVVIASETAPKAPWTTLFQKNRFAMNGMSLSYIPP